MIVKILSRGTSFKGLATYLTHDPDAQTKERVGFTHTLNCANDHVPSAVDEMLWTSRNAEILKQEAGIRAGGRSTENAVKHLSLNWSPDETPTREHMIETAEGFLGHMGWQEHQALLVAHQDKSYAHIHVMLNVIHPETGLRLDDNFERRRAQAWALGYEREQGRIYCKQRLKAADEREDAPTRPAWMAFQEKQREFENAEKIHRDQEPILIRDAEMPENTNDAEWKILKKAQREERQQFFERGKIAFSELRTSIYRDTREEFRDRWSDFYTAEKDGADPEVLAQRKAELVAEQKAVLEERRDDACAVLLASRQEDYRTLLDDQREIRLGLRWRQDAGLENGLFLQAVSDREAPQDIPKSFRDAADAVTEPERRPLEAWQVEETTPPFSGNSHERSSLKSEGDIGAAVGISAGLGLVDILGGIADGLVWSKPDPKPPRPQKAEPAQRDLFSAAIIDQARQRQRSEQEEADRDWRLKQRGNDGI